MLNRKKMRLNYPSFLFFALALFLCFSVHKSYAQQFTPRRSQRTIISGGLKDAANQSKNKAVSEDAEANSKEIMSADAEQTSQNVSVDNDASQNEIANNEMTQDDAAQNTLSQDDAVQSEVTSNEMTQDDTAQNTVSQDDAVQSEVTSNEMTQDDSAQNTLSQDDAVQSEVTSNEMTQDDSAQNTLSQDDAVQTDRDSKSSKSISKQAFVVSNPALDLISKPHVEMQVVDSLSINPKDTLTKEERKLARRGKFLTDSTSLSKMTWGAALLPGYGQIYNKQYWKLPILYGALAGGIALYAQENSRYKPLKKEFDELTLTDPSRTEYIDNLQSDMIRSNTRRQIYLGATVASYIYFLSDAAMNYSTNEVSDIKRATTLATICPGAGQIYNKAYWKVPFVVGGFATLIYVLDWNNRGFTRFKKAYSLRADYDANPDNYPDGSEDEFGGNYSADYLLNIRNSYRRNRDLSIIILAALYGLQIIDAHVDAHFKDYDVSDNLAMSIDPALDYAYNPSSGISGTTIGFNIGFKF